MASMAATGAVDSSHSPAADSAAAILNRPPAGSIDSGILLLDKPDGMSSNRALQQVKRALAAGKAGHAGTLDPLATGMLPILLGEATKVAGLLLGKDKAYQVTCRLGQNTDTYDADGQVVRERPIPDLDPAAIEQALSGLRGLIRQRPPAYSAIKVAGQPLYKRARRGEEITVPERAVRIDRLTLLAQRPQELDLHVECGSGTYIRSLVHDLGEVLGCGAHVTELRRVWVQPFRGQAMPGLDQVLTGTPALLDPAVAVGDWPQVRLDPEQLAVLRQGRRLPARAGLAPGQSVAALELSGRLAGLLLVAANGELQPQRLLVGPAH